MQTSTLYVEVSIIGSTSPTESSLTVSSNQIEGIRQQVRDGAHSGNHRLTQYPVVASQYRANRVRHQWLYQSLSGFYRENALREDSHHRDQGRPSGQ